LSQIRFARAADQVDLLLVLAMDVSRSMIRQSFQLQGGGNQARRVRSSNPAASDR
jgi:hypothetical protein